MIAVVVLIFGFNTQPPEGGWEYFGLRRIARKSFNTQPPEGGWAIIISR